MEDPYTEGQGGIAAIIELSKDIKLDPDNALLYVRRSQCFRVIQQYYHAWKDAESVVNLRPEWSQGYYLKGLAEFGAEHYGAAVESFEDGLQYSSDDKMIRALQKANRAWFINRITERCRVLQGLFLGCVVGALALATNDFVLPSPLVKNVFLKIILFSAWGYCGVEMAKNYSKMLEKDREKRLQAPSDLFPFVSESRQPSRQGTASSSVGTSTSSETHVKSGLSSATTTQRKKEKDGDTGQSPSKTGSTVSS